MRGLYSRFFGEIEAESGKTGLDRQMPMARDEFWEMVFCALFGGDSNAGAIELDRHLKTLDIGLDRHMPRVRHELQNVIVRIPVLWVAGSQGDTRLT